MVTASSHEEDIMIPSLHLITQPQNTDITIRKTEWKMFNLLLRKLSDPADKNHKVYSMIQEQKTTSTQT